MPPNIGFSELPLMSSSKLDMCPPGSARKSVAIFIRFSSLILCSSSRVRAIVIAEFGSALTCVISCSACLSIFTGWVVSARILFFLMRSAKAETLFLSFMRSKLITVYNNSCCNSFSCWDIPSLFTIDTISGVEA